MNCPKCGASGQERRAECSSCGLLFNRWRPRELSTLSRPLPPRMPPPQPSGLAINYWLAGSIGGTVLIVFALWAFSRPSAPSPAPKPVAAQAVAPRRGAPIPLTVPSEEEIRAVIQRCSTFEERLWARLPHSFDANMAKEVVARYPALQRAEQMRIVVLMPPIDLASAAKKDPTPSEPGEKIVLLPGSAAQGFYVTQIGDEWQLDLGYRRLHTIGRVERHQWGLSADFQWTVDTANLLPLASETGSFAGTVTFRPGAKGGWEMASVSLHDKSGSRVLCR